VLAQQAHHHFEAVLGFLGMFLFTAQLNLVSATRDRNIGISFTQEVQFGIFLAEKLQRIHAFHLQDYFTQVIGRFLLNNAAVFSKDIAITTGSNNPACAKVSSGLFHGTKVGNPYRRCYRGAAFPAGLLTFRLCW
jgi:hypothetical protein